MGQISINRLRRSFDLKLYSLLIFVAAADFIFFKSKLGWAVGLFSLFFLAFLSYYNSKALDLRFGKVCLWSAFSQALVMAYDPNLLSYVLYLVSVILLTFLGKGFESANALKWMGAIGQFLLSIFINYFEEINKYFVVKGRTKRRNKLSEIFSRWTLAFVMSVIFIFLFSMANPLIGNWFKGVDLTVLMPEISPLRILFWTFAAMIFTPFLKPPHPGILEVTYEEVERKQSWLFNKKSILNALVAFNFIFLVQTFSDLVYLWGGAGLPEGMTYATYAQQGAYPLMVTALLAAAFVLVALRSQGHSSADGWVKRMIYFWVAQNIFLVVSSIMRTNLYIEQYSLTYLRFSAVVWMGLVAFGLASIILCMVHKKSNIWLVNVNAGVAMIVLYVCSVLNIGGIIANYNVRHCNLIAGSGAALDPYYLNEIGTASLPALKWLKDQQGGRAYQSVAWVEPILEGKLQDNLNTWRSWTFREYLLSIR